MIVSIIFTPKSKAYAMFCNLLFLKGNFMVRRLCRLIGAQSECIPALNNANESLFWCK